MEYLPFYASSEVSIQRYSDISSYYLEQKSFSLWRSLRIDNPNSGIFGELFLDFYARVCNDDSDVLYGFAARRSYRSRGENKGVDYFGYSTKGGHGKIIFGEAKFVKNSLSAQKELISDIQNHVKDIELNSFCGFALQKVDSGNIQLKDANITIDKLNDKMFCEDKTFICAANELGVSVHMIFFAIFQPEKDDYGFLRERFCRINTEATDAAGEVSLNNFSYEVVFIPVDNVPMDIRKKIIEYYNNAGGRS